MKRETQTRVALQLLRSGPKYSTELESHGVGRPNSRVAQLRGRGHEITCERVEISTGTAYRYTLIYDAERSASAPVAPAAAGGGGRAPESHVLHVGTCASWMDGPCDCIVGIALAEVPNDQPLPGPVGTSASAAARPRPADGAAGAAAREVALDMGEQPALFDEAELLAIFGGGA